VKAKSFITTAVLFFSLLQIGCNNNGSKSEYAILQKIEFTQRRNVISKVEIKKIDNYLVAGFRADNDKENVWILLNVKYAPYYKQIPQARFSLTAIELEVVKKNANVSSTVIAVLETRIVAKPATIDKFIH
jgi:hypothetical protein